MTGVVCFFPVFHSILSFSVLFLPVVCFCACVCMCACARARVCVRACAERLCVCVHLSTRKMQLVTPLSLYKQISCLVAFCFGFVFVLFLLLFFIITVEYYLDKNVKKPKFLPPRFVTIQLMNSGRVVYTSIRRQSEMLFRLLHTTAGKETLACLTV